MEADLNNVVPLPAYFEQRKHLFPSATSGEWFTRRHRAQLVEAGALIVLSKRLHANIPKFDSCVLAIGQQQAARAAG